MSTKFLWETYVTVHTLVRHSVFVRIGLAHLVAGTICYVNYHTWFFLWPSVFLSTNQTLPREKNILRNVLERRLEGSFLLGEKQFFENVIVCNACEAPFRMRVASPCSVLHCWCSIIQFLHAMGHSHLFHNWNVLYLVNGTLKTKWTSTESIFLRSRFLKRWRLQAAGGSCCCGTSEEWIQ